MSAKVYNVDQWGDKEGKGILIVESGKIYEVDQWGD
jgi:hypothetical protein